MEKESKIYNKLIRDKMRTIIENDCKSVKFSVVTGKEKEIALKNKLIEEVNEYVESGHVTELADILEVIHAICEFKNVNFDEIEQIRTTKKEKKGGFDTGLFLESIIFNEK